MALRILTFNQISPRGLARFPADRYQVGADVAEPDAILVRSAELTGTPIAATVRAIGRARPATPAVWDYQAMAQDGSMLNTPATFAWYVAGLVLRWLKGQGGLAAIAARNRAKAQLLYDAIDSSGFYRNPVAVDCRSWMNVPFILADARLDEEFLAGARAAGLANLAGHRSVGGMRASLYNAMPLAGVEALVAYMREFARRRG